MKAAVNRMMGQTAANHMMGTTFLGVRVGTDHLGYKWGQRTVPKIKNPTDVIARVHKTTICGTDLHIFGGNVPNAKAGLGLGHEGIVDVLEVGSAVTKIKVGDRMLVPCISRCGRCKFCDIERYGNCEDEEGGWVLGHTIDGMQNEFVRVPHADTSCYPLPSWVKKDSSDEDSILMLADIIPTAYEIGLVDGDMEDGKTLCVIGVGPVGLAAVIAAKSMYNAKRIMVIDLDAERLRLAEEMGATDTFLSTKDDDAPLKVAKEVMQSCGDEGGVDVVVEAVGLPSGWYTAQEIVKPGGNIAVLGVHGKPVTLNMERMWYRNFKMTAGMVHCYSIHDLMRKIGQGDLPAHKLISHRWNLDQIEVAYDTFDNRKDGALKQLITNKGPASV